MEDENSSTVKPMLLGSLGALFVGGLIFMLMPQSEIADAPPTGAVSPVMVSEAMESAPESAAEAMQETIVEAAPEIAIEAPAPQPVVQVPAFDTFRVEADGSMVIAGRAEPRQTIDVMLAGEAIDRVVADDVGNFVSFTVADPAEQPRRLSLLADPDGAAVASTTSYIVAPIAAPVVTAAAPPAPDADAAPETPQTAAATAPQAPTAPQADSAPVAPVAPTVLQTDADGVRVVQASPTLTAPEVEPNIALDAITYDPDGEIQLSGRATGDGAVQVYIDNKPVTASPVTEGGDWRLDLPDIETGVYTLRIDEVDQAGGVISRLETPFKREEAAEVAAVLAEETSQDGFEVAVRTVQPGATLWAIAEENFGNGIFYVEVFEANADLIRDPDLIYPGQIFRIPDITQ